MMNYPRNFIIAITLCIILLAAFLLWSVPKLDRSPDYLCPPHDFSIFLEEKDSAYSHYETYACRNCEAVTTYIN